MFRFDASPGEILEQAMRNEATTRAYLLQLAERISDETGRRSIVELADRKLMHRSDFERRFREMFGEEPPRFPDPSLEEPPGAQPIDVARALKLALERERDLESNWRFLAEQVAEDDSRRLLLTLAEVQWRIRNEVQQLYDEANPGDFLEGW